ncbi:MAG: queuosine precursor transporter [Bacteroidales bacterium]|nr:queuosine precursor transporter [Bacteroidales bacterium]
MSITPAKRQQAETLYLILASLFITSLVTSNLIFQKFFHWNPFGLFEFQLSVGIIAYPVTFLITDIISEVYGQKRANKVVISGIFASAFALLIIIVSTQAEATEWSPLSDQEFNKAFSFTYIAVAASLAAYLLAQFIDVQIFHFWKRVTKGKHLWLRNNFSTFLSQFVDTLTILLLLCSFEVIEWKYFSMLLINGFLFKLILALLDTPFAYLAVYGLRRHFGLKGYGTELNLDN